MPVLLVALALAAGLVCADLERTGGRTGRTTVATACIAMAAMALAPLVLHDVVRATAIAAILAFAIPQVAASALGSVVAVGRPR